MMRKFFLISTFLTVLVMLPERSIAQASPSPSPVRSLKFCKIVNFESSIPPTMDARRYGMERLFDGKLPSDGWRSQWTAWYQKNPSITLDCGKEKRIGAIRVYFQAFARDDELKSILVEVSLDGQKFLPFNEYGEIISLRERGRWVEMNLKAVRARYFRLTPQYQGWGHQWGEVELWELSS